MFTGDHARGGDRRFSGENRRIPPSRQCQTRPGTKSRFLFEFHRASARTLTRFPTRGPNASEIAISYRNSPVLRTGADFGEIRIVMCLPILRRVEVADALVGSNAASSSRRSPIRFSTISSLVGRDG
jgi:hypothetical protein